jgi:hypothetical protein
MVVSNTGRHFSLVVLLLVCACTLNVFAAAKRKKKPTPVKQEQPAPEPAIVETPPAELTLEQKPAVPPTVTYQNNQLTIVAENSTLGDVLRAVKTQTGATIDLPANTNARVVANLGPGPSRDVLAHLLNGTLFNYVLLGTVNDPAAVGKIILIPKPAGNEAQTAANVPPHMQQNYPAINQPAQGEDQSEAADTEAPPEEENSANTTEEPQQPEQPAAAAPNGQQPNVRTPEQLLQELQRQQILQQQMQQQQAGPQQPNQQPAPEPEQN